MGLPEPLLINDSLGDPRDAVIACWDHTFGAYVRFWRTSDNRLIVHSMHSGKAASGRAMLKWLNDTYQLPVSAIEVLPHAKGFWRKMQTEGMVHEMLDEGTSRGFDEGLAVPLQGLEETPSQRLGR